MMKRKLTLFAAILLCGQLSAQLINEFQPNPPGGDPANQDIELKGTPGSSLTGSLVSIEADGSSAGTIDRLSTFTGTFDGNGLLVVNIPDLENPGFTLVLTLNDGSAMLGDDLDTDNDGNIDDPSVLGTVLDAIGVPDEVADENTIYGSQLGGTDFQYTGSEPELIFRDGVSNVLFAVNDLSAPVVEAISTGGTVIAGMDFDLDPSVPTFQAINPSTSVAPVRLVDFKVAKLNNNIQLSWSTLNESGNDYFAIERSTDGGRTFNAIGQVDGAGNSSNLLAYQFMDVKPVAGTTFYRLRQVDFDGTKAFYGPLSVSVNSTSTAPRISPNPATDVVYLSNLPAGIQQVTMYNAIGRAVKKVDLGVAATNTIDLAGLPRGMYLLRFGSHENAQTVRLLKE